MKRPLVTGLAGFAVVIFQSVACAQQIDAKRAQAEAKEHGCLNCHAVDAVKVGPSYRSVSAKFKGKAADDVSGAMKAAAVHKAVLKKTGDQDLKLISQWILTL